jgi:orotate phosphoribosyltransferase
MIEDVTTSGKSMEETVPKVRGAADVEIKGLIVSLNRNEKGKSNKTALKEVSELYGFPTNAIVSMPEVVEYLKEKNELDPELEERINAYYAQYGATE